MQTIGLLLPRSTFYETIGFDLYEGLRSGLLQLGRDDIKIKTENIGFGADKQQCYRSAEKLLLEDNASIVIAYIGHKTAQLLRPLFLAANKILIVLDSGAHLSQEYSSSPNIIYHSLHNALGAWFTAQLAIKEGYTSAGTVTGYYDGGYLQTLSIFNGFENAGGTIVYNHATGYKEDDFDLLPLKEQYNKNPNSAFLTLFSGDFVQWYFRDIKKVFIEVQPAIYLTPFALDEMMLENAIYPCDNVKGIAAWSKKLDNLENKNFIKAIETANKTPNLFSLLAWESATLAIKIINYIDEDKNNSKKITTLLQNFEFESPRGTIQFHSDTNTTLSPLYEASIIKNENGNCNLRIDKKIENTLIDFEILTSQLLDNVTSAWHNSYTCI